MNIKTPQNAEEFIYSLEKPIISKVLRTLDLLEKFGPRLGMPHSKSLGHGLFELRIHGKPDARLMYCFHKNTAFLLHGFVKKSQKTPSRELRTALEKMSTLDRT